MWTIREEEILAAAMLELVARGWKSDNGFRAGYLGLIEDTLRKEFPSTDLRGTPNITSKIAAWKKSYGSLRAILGRSGVGFNTNGDYKIDCDDDQWEAIVMADSDAKFMRPKSWPLWETWKSIFGKDRAGGTGAVEMEEASERFRTHLGSGSQSNENSYHPVFDEDPESQTVPLAEGEVQQDTSSRQSDKQPSPTESGIKSQKRKLDNPDSSLMEFLANLHSETNSRLELISSRIGYEFDLGRARQDVFDKLGTVEGLTLEQRYDLCNILGDKPQRMEVFLGMPASACLGYLLRLIAESHYGY